MDIRDWLQKQNIKPHNRGYYYIIHVVKILKDEILPLVKLTKIYHEIAQGYNTTPESVEKTISYVRSKSADYFYMSNKEFFFELAEKVQRGQITIEPQKEVEV